MTFGDGSHAQVLGKGTIEIPGFPLLKDVLYIKGLKANLLSITQIVMMISWYNSLRRDV